MKHKYIYKVLQYKVFNNSKKLTNLCFTIKYMFFLILPMSEKRHTVNEILLFTLSTDRSH